MSMIDRLNDVRDVSVMDVNPGYIFSLCTLVTDWDLYDAMLQSALKAGFSKDRCEYLVVDNTQGNQLDAYAGINRMLAAASGRYIILCHQDILYRFDDSSVLERRIEQMYGVDEAWAVLGNAGACDFVTMAVRITDPYYDNVTLGQLPAKVHSLDENFMVLRRDANLGLSRDLQGFHFYGLDLCLQAQLRGYAAYVIDFHVEHVGGAGTNPSFYRMKKEFVRKYQRLFGGRFLKTTCTSLYISDNALKNKVLNWGFVRHFIGYLMRKLKR